MIFGEVILAISLFLVLKSVEPVELLIPSIITASVIYLLLFSTIFNFFGIVNNIGHTTSGLGFLWSGIVVYALLATGSVIVSYFLALSVGLFVLLQAVAIFILLIFVLLSLFAKGGVEEGMRKVDNRKLSLKMASSQLDQVEITIQTGRGDLRSRAAHIVALKEDMRYITYSEREDALAMDNRLILAFDTLMKNTTCDDQTWAKLIENCKILILMRKKLL